MRSQASQTPASQRPARKPRAAGRAVAEGAAFVTKAAPTPTAAPALTSALKASSPTLSPRPKSQPSPKPSSKKTAARTPTPAPQRPRRLAEAVVATLTRRIHGGELATGQQLPTEGDLMHEFGVSRTVVREALSQLQASALVHTRHGVGTFVAAREASASFRVAANPQATLQDVIALLELRIGVESEAAGLAAQRRKEAHLARLRSALAAFSRAVEAGLSAVEADFAFHHEVAKATGNSHFAQLLGTLGVKSIPRARLAPTARARTPDQQAYLRRVHAEHESIYDAIAAADADAARAAMRTHLANSRERRRREAGG